MADKTERPTARRLQRARRDGDIAKSSHLSTAVSGLLWWLLLVFEAPRIFRAFVHMADSALSVDAARSFAWQLDSVLGALIEPGLEAFMLLGLGILAVTIPEFAQTRGLVAFKRISPDFRRINPIEGFKNLFTLKILFDTALMIFQFVILIYIAWHEISTWLGLTAASYALAPATQLSLIGHANTHLIALVALSQLAPAAGDYAMQHVLRKRRLRMDKDELKREYRDDQGDPHVKGHRRALHRQLNS
jgi:type III secretion protein U